MKYTYPTWGYKQDGEARLFKSGEEIDRKVWADTPAKWKEQPEDEILAEMTKKDLEDYALNKFEVDLDRRWTKERMLEKIMELES